MRSGQSTRLARRWKACSQSVAWQGSLGKPESVRALGAVAAAGSREALEQEVRAMHEAGLRVFRGGQRPGLSRDRVVGAVHELLTHAVDVPLALTRLRSTSLTSFDWSKGTGSQQSEFVFPDTNVYPNPFRGGLG